MARDRSIGSCTGPAEAAKPIMVSETSWHDGHPIHHHRYPGLNKGTWLRHVSEQVDIAKFHGANVVG